MNENKVIHAAQANLPTRYGNFALHIFRDGQGTEHMAVVAGTPQDGALVRLHSECATGDILGSLRCDCRDQLESALRAIGAASGGIVLYLRGHEGRGMGLANKIRAYALQEQGLDTVSANQQLGFAADTRDYAAAAAMLQHFGLTQVRLMTNNRQKLAALAAAGITVTERVPFWMAENPHNEDYLATKRAKLGHLR